jgi:Zc3h12a-like Ribonuclease NYN domain
MAKTHHVVVDGSNFATEGRKSPSLRQLDEAVRAYAEEDPDAEIVVVVDASFDHRIDKSERAELEEAQLQGEIVWPPAGAIGRGDAFVLRIAERTGAVVLSNDSFQEFHAEHPWLFDEGRLVGGKPVPGVGWIFTPRTPVRGPKSRRVTGRLKSGDVRAEPTAPVKAAELAKAVKKAAARRATLPDGSTPKIGDVFPVTPRDKKGKKADSDVDARTVAVESSEDRGITTGTGQKVPAKKAAKASATKAVAKKATKAPAKKAAKAAAPKAVAKKEAKAPAKKAAKASASKAAVKKAPAKKAAKAPAKKAAKVAAEKPPKKLAPKKDAKTEKDKAPAKKAAKASASKAAVKKAPAKKAGEGRAAKVAAPRRPRAADAVLRDAIDEATAEVLAPSRSDGAKAKDGHSKSTKQKSDAKDEKGGKSRKRRAKRRGTVTPLPAVNEPLDFITFVAEHPLGSEVEGEVVSYTSHGAMVAANLPDGRTLDCYIPLTGLAVPAPTKARQVLSKGERRTFVLTALDPARRVAELALPGVAP